MYDGFTPPKTSADETPHVMRLNNKVEEEDDSIIGTLEGRRPAAGFRRSAETVTEKHGCNSWLSMSSSNSIMFYMCMFHILLLVS